VVSASAIWWKPCVLESASLESLARSERLWSAGQMKPMVSLRRDEGFEAAAETERMLGK